MSVVDQELADGVHLILSHDREDERPKFFELKSRSYRATWLTRPLSKKYGEPEFTGAIDDILAFEECWRARIRPGLSSPLLLPETAFSAQSSVSNVWDRARTIHAARDSLDAIENALNRFRTEHRRRTGWHDSNQLVFARDTASHGGYRLEPWRYKKLTFQLPDGYHFDVTHLEGRRFSVLDQYEVSHRFSEYTNIDPHGFIRGGR